ncbi:hypothetical protein SLH49_21995 [Cognatiyoonia sp. IB215446]|uniref:hypothetical protein n=1 Tax=Cognatiyoonia sp. IB215446 TaxID=3097355 RepID=UPI002A0C1FA2|nr:hypothetical protein [Cognatiyoonia sp. IB215446]MDX8350671.1 hypothetical protein [Cognatiyoonia sp. IB215446]
MADLTDYELGHDLLAQKNLLMQAYETGDDELIEKGLTRVLAVRRMKKNGTLEWESPDFEL